MFLVSNKKLLTIRFVEKKPKYYMLVSCILVILKSSQILNLILNKFWNILNF